ncbi:MAG: hypothetical protein FJZ90_00370 [Chloroflexi bacterium]|nr:hypothetical protein [Chloroflexota bacterium]
MEGASVTALTRSFLLAGVGGQGTLLASDVVALVGVELGCDVKKSEVHGMAQRGGSVTSHVRWGEHVYSPLITPGGADFMIGFERLEALRHASMLSVGGRALINDYRVIPVSVTTGAGTYPTEEDEARAYAALKSPPTYVPAIEIASAVGSARVNNVVMLGALSAFLDVPEEVWLRVISRRVPERFISINQRAFSSGRLHALTHLRSEEKDAR